MFHVWTHKSCQKKKYDCMKDIKYDIIGFLQCSLAYLRRGPKHIQLLPISEVSGSPHTELTQSEALREMHLRGVFYSKRQPV